MDIAKSMSRLGLVLAVLTSPAAAEGTRTTTEDGLRALIEDLRECRYDRDQVTERIAKAIEKNCERAKGHLDEYGALKSLRFLGTNQHRRMDMYLLEFENHYVLWQFGRTRSGRIRNYHYWRL